MKNEIDRYKEFHEIDDINLQCSNRIDYGVKVSIILSFLDTNKELNTAIRSIQNQSYKNIETLLVNDSYDAMRNPVCNITYPITYHIINLGAYGARNTGIKSSTGDFITCHDSDDWSHPQKIELQVKALVDNPHAVASVSHWARCTSDMDFETRPDGTVVHRNVSSLMVRREVIERLGYWDRVSVNADTEYYYRIIAAYGPDSIIEVLPGVPLALGRRHANSLTMQPQTHWKTQFGGVRQDYMNAAHEWHKECVKTNKWYMPYAPNQRPFPVPDLIDRSVIELGERVWPHIRGQQVVSENKPRILLCGHASGIQRFGAERSLMDLAKAIFYLGYRLIVTLPERNAAYIDYLKPWCSDIILLPSPWQKDEKIWPIALDAYSRILLQYEIDIVHVNTLVNHVPLMAARQQGVKTIMHVRELLEWDQDLRQSIKSYADQVNFFDADLVLANSVYTAKCITNTGFNGNLRIVANIVELNGVWRTRNFVKGELVRVGMVSSNLPKKGLEDFVAVASASKTLNLPLEFVLIGPTNNHTENLKKTMPDNILILGYCNNPEQALIHLDILLNLSHFQESFGRTVAEAMLAGKPVICYRWGALPELIVNGSNGFLVHLGDVDGIIERLSYFCENPKMIETFGEKAQEMAITRFKQYDFQVSLASAYQAILPEIK